jgi:methanogenic corrinoid protein MtbC1
MPLMETIGDRWSDGTLRVAHEHMATAVVRSFMGALKESRPASDSAPTIVVTTPAGQLHELGALMASVAAASDGWRVNYLGPNLPAEEIAAAARGSSAKVVALSIVHPADDPRLPQEIRALRRLMGDQISIVAGGAVVRAYEETLTEAGAALTPDIPSLRAHLESLRYR